jgi:hypothetical protein
MELKEDRERVERNRVEREESAVKEATTKQGGAITKDRVPPPKQDFSDEEMAEIMARAKPKGSCKKCYGRGHMGRNVTTGKLVVCVCVDKAARIIGREIIARRANEFKMNSKEEVTEDALHSGVTIISEDDDQAWEPIP